MSTTPINEAGITATFAAIFARLEELEHGQEDHHTRLERLESARIATPVAPESAETASEVPMEPGNATRQICGVCDGIGGDCPVCVTSDPEVAAALRMYRKVQALTVAEACGIMRVTYELAAPEVTALLAWLKEGEA